jgi:hypothetical protein
MSENNENNEGFDETVRSIMREVAQSIERFTENIDSQEIADALGMDPAAARGWVTGATDWLREHTESLGTEVGVWATGAGRKVAAEDPLASAGPHPLDLPTEEQGLALAALQSGRWTVEPGTDALAAKRDGPGPSDALGLVRELRVRDWIAADGEVTLVGRHALSRWLEAARPRT